MADLAYRNDVVTVARGRTDWGSIWAGTFVFMAIWSVFGSLGFAIFTSNANPNAAAPITGQTYGLGAWLIVLTVIAMYVAGRETGHVAGVADRHDGLVHGLIMFGLSVVGMALLIILGGTALSGGTGVNGTVHSNYLLNVLADIGWMGFVALFLGWLAAMFGASQGVGKKDRPAANVRDIRPAA